MADKHNLTQHQTEKYLIPRNIVTKSPIATYIQYGELPFFSARFPAGWLEMHVMSS
jgi:hypothetical protein